MGDLVRLTEDRRSIERRLGSSQIGERKAAAAAARASVLVPADREWLAGRVMVLLSHFYERREDEHEARARLQDWVEALARLPEWAVHEACVEYLGSETRTPKPADISRLARKRTAGLWRSVVEAEAAEEPRRPDPEQRARAAEIVGRFKSRREA